MRKEKAASCGNNIHMLILKEIVKAQRCLLVIFMG